MLWIYALIFLAMSFTAALAELNSPPHIIFILADDYGFNDIGYHRSEIFTPNLDQMASDGVKLENYYVQPICTPTRSQLLSGRYQIHTGLQHGILTKCSQKGLPLDHPTVADKLKESGYKTHMVGKWHIGQSSIEYTPTRRGFDTFLGYLGGYEDYYSRKSFSHHDFFLNEQRYRETDGRYSVDVFTERAQAIIEEHNSTTPLFLYLAYQSVHGPLQVPSNYTIPYESIKDKKRRTYAGMVAAMDEGIGKLMDTLKASSLWNNTLVIFSTDNGGATNVGASNYPLRAGKGSYYEGGIRGIGFVTGPLVSAAAGQVNHELIHVTDWFPTLMYLAGGSIDSEELDGYNVWEAILSRQKSPRYEILHNIDPFDSNFRKSESKIFDTTARAALRLGDFKILTGQRLEARQKTYQLFNIANDPHERHELDGQEYPDVVHRMLLRLSYWNSTAVPMLSKEKTGSCFPWLKQE
ncbi:arylsulfatase B-like [Watersipora subatra]|uniref:arylsulfatase B-like n=1 Tax=Watersipora subatra TaxID=2589382 RepID=UPI00355B621A